MKKTVLLPVILILFLALNSGAGAMENTHPAAPEFSLTDLNGNEITLSTILGKVAFLNFWATWCPPCRAEIPDFVEAYKEYKNKGMEIIGISVDKISEKALASFVEKFKMNYPVAFGTQKITKDYEPGQFIPVTIIIDKKGKIRHKHVGQMDKETLVSHFLQLSAENQ